MNAAEFNERIQRPIRLNFGDIFNRALTLFQKVWTQGLLLQLLMILVNYGLFFLMYIPSVGSSFIITSWDEHATDERSLKLIIWMVFILLLYTTLIVCLAIFRTGLLMAFYRIIRTKERGIRQSNINFGMFFKRTHLRKTIYLSLAQVGIFLLAFLLCVFPIIYVSVPLQLAIIIFAFNPELTIRDVYKLAFNLGNKKWLLTFGLIALAAILASIIGIMACFIGIYATLSFVYLPAYFIYKDVIGFREDDDAIASIGMPSS